MLGSVFLLSIGPFSFSSSYQIGFRRTENELTKDRSSDDLIEVQTKLSERPSNLVPNLNLFDEFWPNLLKFATIIKKELEDRCKTKKLLVVLGCAEADRKWTDGEPRSAVDLIW